MKSTLLVLAGLALLPALLSGCVIVPYHWMTMGEPAYVVHAQGFPSRDDPAGSWYNRMQVRLGLPMSPEFIVVLPDGYKAGSKLINSSLLQQHGCTISRRDEDNKSALDYAICLNKSGRKERYSMSFTLNRNGLADSLWINACNHSIPRILGSSDGQRFFDFPMTEADIMHLFQIPIQHSAKTYALEFVPVTKCEEP